MIFLKNCILVYKNNRGRCGYDIIVNHNNIVIYHNLILSPGFIQTKFLIYLLPYVSIYFALFFFVYIYFFIKLTVYEI